MIYINERYRLIIILISHKYDNINDNNCVMHSEMVNNVS